MWKILKIYPWKHSQLFRIVSFTISNHLQAVHRVINLAGEQGLDDTQHCVGRKIFHSSSSWGWCWCTNQYFFYLPPEWGRYAGPPGCPAIPATLPATNASQRKGQSWDTRCFTNTRRLAWCSLSLCSVWGWSRGPWMRGETRDGNRKTINWSQTSQSHYMPLNHSFKLQHLVRKSQRRCHVLNLMSFHLKSKLTNSLKIPTCFSLYTTKITLDFNATIHLS